MHPLEIIDELYEVFVGMVYGPLVDSARALAFTLGLAPSRDVPWSRVFGNEITLAAPVLIAEGMADVPEACARDATFAHMLAVIEAFASDRIADRQIRGTAPLLALLRQMRTARDRALRRVAPGTSDPSIDFALADDKTRYAILSEHAILDHGKPATFATYETVSLGKQSPGFPAPLAMAFAAGWEPRRRTALYQLLASVWLGLQMHDDVVDWEDDLARGGAWAVALAKGRPEARTPARSSEVVSMRQRVHASGVLEQMLSRSRGHFRAARLRARLLGARRLELWAGQREAKLAALVAAERSSPGYAVRAHALGPWAGEVLVVTRERPGWEFPYAALRHGAEHDGDVTLFDAVVATVEATPRSEIAAAIRELIADAEVTPLLARTPLFWTRIRSASGATRDAMAEALARGGIAVRYVTSSLHASSVLGPPLRFAGAARARATSWRLAGGAVCVDDPPIDGRWFLRDGGGGVAVDRTICGIGGKTRLAVIDHDAAEADTLRLDALVPVGIVEPPRATSHGALMVAWAVGCRGFQGVAPGSAPRLYCIPKPGVDVVSLPLAIARATLDGADVIACATYVEGCTSPMMDDALAVASTLGRRGRGTAVVIPTGREASSAEGSLHSSWTLALSDLACDPRVFCIGPGARDGQWFMWRDRRGRLRPFANRGPSVRWLAPGDDVAYPFGHGSDRARLFHAESSGASAIAAGVLLLVLGANPTLRLGELESIVTRTAEPLSPDDDARRGMLADAWDVLPLARDADGHNAKHGYGLINASRACLAAVDPIALALLTIGEQGAAQAWHSTHRARPWSRRLARWTVRAVLGDARVAHHLAALARHARLVAGHEDRQRAQGEGAFARQIALFVRGLAAGHARRPRSVPRELARLADAMASPAIQRRVEASIHASLSAIWSPRADPSPPDVHDARFGEDRVRL